MSQRLLFSQLVLLDEPPYLHSGRLVELALLDHYMPDPLPVGPLGIESVDLAADE